MSALNAQHGPNLMAYCNCPNRYLNKSGEKSCENNDLPAKSIVDAGCYGAWGADRGKRNPV
jgi:hypothetical protein